MNSKRLEELLLQLVDSMMDEDFCDENGIDYSDAPEAAGSFRQEGILTNNRGLVVSFPNGAEFQITIVQSACGEEDDSDEDE